MCKTSKCFIINKDFNMTLNLYNSGPNINDRNLSSSRIVAFLEVDFLAEAFFVLKSKRIP